MITARDGNGQPGQIWTDRPERELTDQDYRHMLVMFTQKHGELNKVTEKYHRQ
jgi:hypothetical protein